MVKHVSLHVPFSVVTTATDVKFRDMRGQAYGLSVLCCCVASYPRLFSISPQSQRIIENNAHHPLTLTTYSL